MNEGDENMPNIKRRKANKFLDSKENQIEGISLNIFS